MHVDNIIFEVTRRCNMQCDFCLRGEPQRVNMTEEIVNKVLDHIDSVNSITFTGGEPMMNFKLIKYIFFELANRNIEYFSFWLATNGKICNSDIIDTLQTEYDYLTSGLHSDFCGGIALSIDQYHDPISQKNKERYMNLEFYDKSREMKRKHTDIIMEGRAEENGIGEPKRWITDKLDYEIDNDEIRITSQIYINALGDVLTECDYSYESQEDHIIGNVLETPLNEILFNQVKLQAPENFYETIKQPEMEDKKEIAIYN